jgi:hypothetical protein
VSEYDSIQTDMPVIVVSQSNYSNRQSQFNHKTDDS